MFADTGGWQCVITAPVFSTMKLSFESTCLELRQMQSLLICASLSSPVNPASFCCHNHCTELRFKHKQHCVPLDQNTHLHTPRCRLCRYPHTYSWVWGPQRRQVNLPLPGAVTHTHPCPQLCKEHAHTLCTACVHYTYVLRVCVNDVQWGRGVLATGITTWPP